MSDWCIETLTPQVLRQLLTYDPETGELRWLERDARWFKAGAISAESAAAEWNRRYAGQCALVAGAAAYGSGSVLGVSLNAHRAAWAVHFGSWPAGTVDHINGDTRDNRIANLRDVTTAENRRNSKLLKTNQSGVSGVRWDAKAGSWVVMIGRKTYVGSFKKFEDAVEARRQAEIDHGYHPNHGRAEGAKA